MYKKNTYSVNNLEVINLTDIKDANLTTKVKSDFLEEKSDSLLIFATREFSFHF